MMFLIPAPTLNLGKKERKKRIDLIFFVQPMYRLKGKVAIITGGASGFGEATARLFVRHGANVIIADVQDEKGRALCNDIASGTDYSGSSSISYARCNVTDDTSVKNVVDLAISKYGKLDIMSTMQAFQPCRNDHLTLLVNVKKFSGDLDKTILGTTNKNFKKVFDVNVYGAFLGAKHAARVMIPRKSGVILFTASLASVVCGETSHAYTMSKNAIVGLMKNLVNAISPCAVSTPIHTHSFGIDKATLDEVITESAVLKGATLDAMDVAHAALYLASDEAKLVRGLNLMVDGGYTGTNPAVSLTFKRGTGGHNEGSYCPLCSRKMNQAAIESGLPSLKSQAAVALIQDIGPVLSLVFLPNSPVVFLGGTRD
ncbi:hypothetical protein Cgig2_021687 [Carnegiea gigantea]|uniref:Uncharacterized protein n=1 Tax=Carnegiea gigantea TaxID=171969 RepID=A0A9Q1KUP0_9CARY|nr:hypothetical protein Cgig2_021687 [Carnegiea gigantea]